jgi:hypothetical protein
VDVLRGCMCSACCWGLGTCGCVYAAWVGRCHCPCGMCLHACCWCDGQRELCGGLSLWWWGLVGAVLGVGPYGGLVVLPGCMHEGWAA